MAVAKIAHCERGSLSRIATQLPGAASGGPRFHRLHAKHKRHDSVFAALGGVCDADGDAIAQHRGAITERGNLGHAMRNENYRIAALAPAPHNREDPFRQVRRKSGGDLVQHKHDRIGRERARQIDEPQNWIWNVRARARRI